MFARIFLVSCIEHDRVAVVRVLLKVHLHIIVNGVPFRSEQFVDQLGTTSRLLRKVVESQYNRVHTNRMVVSGPVAIKKWLGRNHNCCWGTGKDGHFHRHQLVHSRVVLQ